MVDVAQAPGDQAPKDLIGFLDYYLVKKAPFQLPDGVKEFLVQYGPWIAVILMVLTLPLFLAALGLGALLAPFAGVGFATGFGIVALGAIVRFVLTAMALPGLFARKMSGWMLIFYAQLVGIVTSLLAGSIIGAIIGGLIGLYLLFQIRPLYKA